MQPGIRKKILWAIAVSVILIAIAYFMKSSKNYSGVFIDDLPKHWPEQNVITTFTTITLDADFDKFTPVSKLRFSKDEFSDLALSKCTEVFRTFPKMEDVKVSHLSQPYSFKGNPLNLGITFLVHKKRLQSKGETSEIEVMYRFTRISAAWNELFLQGRTELGNIASEGLVTVFSGREQPGITEGISLPDDKQDQISQLSIAISNRCKLLAEEMVPNFNAASRLEKRILNSERSEESSPRSGEK